MFSRKSKIKKQDTPQISVEDTYLKRRLEMVKYQIEQRDVTNPNVLNAMRSVPRHLFLEPDQYDQAYCDHPLSIGEGQTISQPYIVALMTELMNPGKNHVVLEIGTGSGYQSAILSLLVKHVYTIERHKFLADRASERLKKLGYLNVDVICGDGYAGLPQYAPYDSIIVTAAPPTTPPLLIEQLKESSPLVVPVGVGDQRLIVLTRHGDKTESSYITAVRFVPMVPNKPPDQQ